MSPDTQREKRIAFKQVSKKNWSASTQVELQAVAGAFISTIKLFIFLCLFFVVFLACFMYILLYLIVVMKQEFVFIKYQTAIAYELIWVCFK